MNEIQVANCICMNEINKQMSITPIKYECVHESILTHIFTSTCVHARMTGKLLIMCNFNVHHSICTTLLYKKLFTKSKNIYLFSFYSTKCPARFNFQNAKSLDFSVLMYQWDILQWEKY